MWRFVRKRFPGIVFDDAPGLTCAGSMECFAFHNGLVDRSALERPPGVRLADRCGLVLCTRYSQFVECGAPYVVVPRVVVPLVAYSETMWKGC